MTKKNNCHKLLKNMLSKYHFCKLYTIMFCKINPNMVKKITKRLIYMCISVIKITNTFFFYFLKKISKKK